MKPRPPTLKLDPNDPDAGRDAMLAVTNSIANWMFVAAAVTFLLGFLLHNCSDFTPLISLPSW
ncbi:MAG: hypothetical protein HYT82_01300 [Candidatus Harrisonbacteria bacterium]|nr:hypothetical protein [Candidatus Harrisonbacteria bacterium]MBI2406071.1 hypothetical protein [Candidatus Harrisonbacteria bacterium]